MDEERLRSQVELFCRKYEAERMNPKLFAQWYTRITGHPFYGGLPLDLRTRYQYLRWFGPSGANHAITEQDLLRGQVEENCRRYETGEISLAGFKRLHDDVINHPSYGDLPKDLRQHFTDLHSFGPGGAAVNETRDAVEELCRGYEDGRIDGEALKGRYLGIVRDPSYSLLPEGLRNRFQYLRWFGPSGVNHRITEHDLLKSHLEECCLGYKTGKVSREAFKRLYIAVITDPLFYRLPVDLRGRLFDLRWRSPEHSSPDRPPQENHDRFGESSRVSAVAPAVENATAVTAAAERVFGQSSAERLPEKLPLAKLEHRTKTTWSATQPTPVSDASRSGLLKAHHHLIFGASFYLAARELLTIFNDPKATSEQKEHAGYSLGLLLLGAGVSAGAAPVTNRWISPGLENNGLQKTAGYARQFLPTTAGLGVGALFLGQAVADVRANLQALDAAPPQDRGQLKFQVAWGTASIAAGLTSTGLALTAYRGARTVALLLDAASIGTSMGIAALSPETQAAMGRYVQAGTDGAAGTIGNFYAQAKQYVQGTSSKPQLATERSRSQDNPGATVSV